MGRMVILTGPRAVGKSTICSKVAARVRQRGYVCGGILTRSDQGVREVLDLCTGLRRRLTTTSEDEDVLTQGRFRFSRETLSWANDALNRAAPCDLLVIDEIGPLEVLRGEGWEDAFEVLEAGGYALALVVVRPELVTQVRDRLSGVAMEIVSVTRENRDDLLVSLVKMTEREA